MITLYADQYCQISNSFIIINQYYFPLATTRIIFYRQIQKITLESCLNVRHKWGLSTHFMNNWFHHDDKRKGKQYFIAIHIKGRKIIPSITPQDSVKVFDIIRTQFESKKYKMVQENQNMDENIYGYGQIQQVQYKQMIAAKYNQGEEQLQQKPSQIQLNPKQKYEEVVKK